MRLLALSVTASMPPFAGDRPLQPNSRRRAESKKPGYTVVSQSVAPIRSISRLMPEPPELLVGERLDLVDVQEAGAQLFESNT